MGNQSGRPEIGQVVRVTRFGGEITNFRDPIHRQSEPVAISPTTANNPPSNIVEGLWTSRDNLEPSAGRLSRKDILDIALHRGENRAKKAA